VEHSRHRDRIRHLLQEMPELPTRLIEMGYETDTSWTRSISKPLTTSPASRRPDPQGAGAGGLTFVLSSRGDVCEAVVLSSIRTIDSRNIAAIPEDIDIIVVDDSDGSIPREDASLRTRTSARLWAATMTSSP
jgi:hypothetical protein